MENTTSVSPKIVERKKDDVLDLIKSIKSPKTIILDFDETLLLRNSTEEYLDSLRPRILGTLLLKILDKSKLWQWLPARFSTRKSRDWMRVVLATVFFPWTYVLWQFKASKLAQAHANTELIEAVNRNPNLKPLVASLGFGFIIRPILNQIPISASDLVACRFWQGMGDRQLGKEELISNHVKSMKLETSILVTDSLDDKSLLTIVELPLLTKWPLAKYEPAMKNAMSKVYIPFFYLDRIKRPGEYMIRNKLITHHLVPLCLALSWTSTMPAIHALGMAFMVGSFWCIYELGYYENDQVAEKYEQDPHLSDTYYKSLYTMSVWQAWSWSILLSAVGIILIGISDNSFLDFYHLHNSVISTQIDRQAAFLREGAWVVGLMLLRATYWIYNHVDKASRTWFYPILQICKYLSFTVVTKSNYVGFALLFGLLLSDWIPYLIYRFGDRTIYKSFPKRMFRCVCFLLVAISMSVGTQSTQILFSWQFLVILAIYAYQSKNQIAESIRKGHPIWQTIPVKTES
jgi:hypothetical protein